jgi:hypothetical protein
LIGPARCLRFAVQTCIVERHRRTPRQFLGKRQVRGVVASFPRSERQQSQRLASRHERNEQKRLTLQVPHQPLVVGIATTAFALRQLCQQCRLPGANSSRKWTLGAQIRRLTPDSDGHLAPARVYIDDVHAANDAVFVHEIHHGAFSECWHRESRKAHHGGFGLERCIEDGCRLRQEGGTSGCQIRSLAVGSFARGEFRAFVLYALALEHGRQDRSHA